jgi:hypothetical protein
MHEITRLTGQTDIIRIMRPFSTIPVIEAYIVEAQ